MSILSSHRFFWCRCLSVFALLVMFLWLRPGPAYSQGVVHPGHLIAAGRAPVVANTINSITTFSVKQVSPQNPLPFPVPSHGSASASFPIIAVPLVKPIVPGTNLQAVVAIRACSWTLGNLQFSSDNITFNPVTTQTPPVFLYDSATGTPTSNTSPQVPIYAVTNSLTTPGYWKVIINLASVSYTLNGGVPVSLPATVGASVATKVVTFVVGATTAVPGFSISIQPNAPPPPLSPVNTLSVYQKAGTTALITVTSINHGSGDITVGGAVTDSHGHPTSFMTYIYSNSNIQDNRGSATATDTVMPDASKTFTLTLCTDMMPYPTPSTPYTLTVTCTSNTALPAMGTAPVQVLNSTPVHGVVNQPAASFPGGLGRRIETPAATNPHFLAIRGAATLPDVVNIVLCGGGPDQRGHGDTADVYLGNGDLDFGLTISHSGKRWTPVKNNPIASWVDNLGNRIAEPAAPSDQHNLGETVEMTLEFPGYPRLASDTRLGPALVDYAPSHPNGIIKAGFVVLNIAGTDYVLKFPPPPSRIFQNTNGYGVKRCNTIAQNVNFPAKFGPGDGPGIGLFWLTGTAVKGGAWKDVEVLLNSDKTWYPMEDHSRPGATPLFTVTDSSTPGNPYVKSTVIKAYSDEENIDMSTERLP